MSRLRKIANNEIEKLKEHLYEEIQNDVKNENNTNMILLNDLDEANVRHDKCPNCKHEPLIRKEGFKVCPVCGSIYKLLEGKGYLIY